MATLSFLNSGQATSASTLNVSVTPTTGRLLVAVIMIHSPFNAPTVSGVTWNSNAMTQTVARDGSGGGSFTWVGGAIYHYEVATGATANVAVTLSGSATRFTCSVYEIDGYNTGAIVGDTDTAEVTGDTHALTLTTATGDVVIDGIVTDNSSADRWWQVTTGTTSGYNNDPRPGSAISKHASGYKTASGSSTAISWEFWGFDAGPILVGNEGLHVAAVFQTAGASASIVPILNSYRLRSI